LYFFDKGRNPHQIFSPLTKSARSDSVVWRDPAVRDVFPRSGRHSPAAAF
jgi:hypothetical protein